eukprot:scaffold32392_cov57-Phaeocystis_antarctica.AAC.2
MVSSSSKARTTWHKASQSRACLGRGPGSGSGPGLESGSGSGARLRQREGIAVARRAEELIAEPLAAARALGQPGDVHLARVRVRVRARVRIRVRVGVG